MALTIQKKTTEHTFPGRFRDMQVRFHVADKASGANAGKLFVTMHDSTPGGGFVAEACVDDLPAPDLASIAAAIGAATQKNKLKAGIRELFAVLLAKSGATGTPEPEDDPPA